MPKIDRRLLILLALGLFLSLWRLETVPPLWWDEGWNLTVARNWVELGHYGRLLDGKPESPGMSNGFTTVAPVALSFRLLGVGIWQGRLPSVLFLLGSLLLIYYLAGRLYNRNVAVATLFILLFMAYSVPKSLHFTVHPAFVGRQVLGESPALCYLLAGYACFLSAFSRPLLFMPLTWFFWGLALITKLQVLPFWTLSLLAPLALSGWQRDWKKVIILSIALFGSLLTSQRLTAGVDFLLRDQTLPVATVQGLYGVTALVTAWHIRWSALLGIYLFGLPTLIGLSYGWWAWFQEILNHLPQRAEETLRLALLSLAGSWFTWYVLLSAAWDRYLYPSIFLGSIFTAAALGELTQNFSLRGTLDTILEIWKSRRFSRAGLKALLAVALITTTVPPTLVNTLRYFSLQTSTAALETAHFLNTHTPQESLIETYDSELFFLLDRRYHYPPDQVNVEFVKAQQGQAVDNLYDPLAVDPDYLVIGPFMKSYRVLYEKCLKNNDFTAFKQIGGYEIFRRNR